MGDPSALDADTIVIGASVLGASIAAHRALLAPTLLLEASREPLSPVSLATFACCNAHEKQPEAYARLGRDGLAAHRRLSAEAPDALRWYDEIGTTFDGVAITAQGFADVGRYLADAQRRFAAAGGVRRDGTEVVRVEPADAGGVARVVLRDGGALTARHVVLAVGVATPGLLPEGARGTTRIGDATGPAGFVAHVRDARLVPGTVVITYELSLRPLVPSAAAAAGDTGAGVAMVQSLALEAELLAEGLPSDRATAWPRLRRRIADVTGVEVADDALLALHAGPRPVSADGLPVLGEVAPGVHVALSHSGVTLAPIIGELVARDLDAHPADADPRLAPFRPDASHGDAAPGRVGDHGMTPPPSA